MHNYVKSLFNKENFKRNIIHLSLLLTETKDWMLEKQVGTIDVMKLQLCWKPNNKLNTIRRWLYT